MGAEFLKGFFSFSKLVQLETVFSYRNRAQLPATFALCVRETQHHIGGEEPPGAPTRRAALWK